jgi:tetratricopeptide (TPR) repeat protein
MAASLYPESDAAHVYHAIDLIILGDKAGARAAVKKGASVNANGIAGAGASNQIGRALAGINQLDAAIEWRHLAIELYPQEAALQDTLGDMYLKKGRMEMLKKLMQ